MRSSTVLMPARLRQLNERTEKSSLLNGHFKHLIVLRFSLFNNGGLGADFLGQVYEQIEVVAQNLCTSETASRALMVASVHTSSVSLS